MTKSNMGGKGLFCFTLSGYSSSLREITAGAQGGNLEAGHLATHCSIAFNQRTHRQGFTTEKCCWIAHKLLLS